MTYQPLEIITLPDKAINMRPELNRYGHHIEADEDELAVAAARVWVPTTSTAVPL